MPKARPLRVCLLCVEIFAFGKYGGFGRATRIIGAALARRGLEVHAIVPLRAGQGAVESLDGMTARLPAPAGLIAALASGEIDADIHHSQHLLATAIALAAPPGRRHIVTCRDPKSLRDWRIELARPSLSRAQVLANWLFEDGPGVATAVRRLDGVFAASPHLVAAIARKYGLPEGRIGLLPTPVRLPPEPVKATVPTVISVGRWDRRKRPELFIELARAMPAIRFVAIGRSRDPAYEAGAARPRRRNRQSRACGLHRPVRERCLDRRSPRPGCSSTPPGARACRPPFSRPWPMAAPSSPRSTPAASPAASAKPSPMATSGPGSSGSCTMTHGAARARPAARTSPPTSELDRVVDQHLALYERLLATEPARRWRPVRRRLPHEAGLNILILCYEYPPLGGGGSRVVAGLARALADAGHAVTIYTSRMARFAGGRNPDSGVRVRRVRTSGRRHADRARRARAHGLRHRHARKPCSAIG
ncbi:MAG: glycosyltransferase [Geminicoccaceae bacterium]